MKCSSERKQKIYLIVVFGLISCALYGIGAGIRSNVGIILTPMAKQCVLQYNDVSFCVAVMQLVFGASQPFFGILAARKSNRIVLLSGVGLLACSMIGIMLARSFIVLMLSLGILFGLGCGAISFGLVLTSSIHFIGAENSMTISGMLNAASGMFGFVLAPIIQRLLSLGGLKLVLSFLIAVFLVLIPLSFMVTSKDPKQKAVAPSGSEKEPLPFRTAFKNRTYRLLLAGFSTCGFHMVIIESHLFSQYVSYGIAETAASWAFSFYGIATIVGALLSGFLSTRLNKGKLLAFYYGFRAVWVALYLFVLPKTVVTALIFSVGLGLTGDATVSPTSGLVNEQFDLKQVATLIGLLFLVHQIGAFFSAWLGGIFVNQTGSYKLIWLVDIALCVFASIMSASISVECHRSRSIMEEKGC
ncbi:MAG: MFS transporter [Eubacteriales bacterium]|nr:MFS transporter [Eubacteriales bacterium]